MDERGVLIEDFQRAAIRVSYFPLYFSPTPKFLLSRLKKFSI